MEKKIVASAKAPKAVGTYSQAVIAGNTIYVSGQLPIDATTGEFVPGGIEEQLHQVFKNLQYVLEEGGYVNGVAGNYSLAVCAYCFRSFGTCYNFLFHS